jgi:hypothetical protein
MPKFYEVYGNDVYDQSPSIVFERQSAYCPFTESICDGGGNRHQTKIRLENSRLRDRFNTDLTSVVPGVCSIESGGEVWIVCPRRLLGFKNPSTPIVVNATLQEHEKAALIAAGVPKGIEMGIWSEVYLQYGDDQSAINYHFDFVISPIMRETSFSEMLEAHEIVLESDVKDLKISAKKGKYLLGKFDSERLLPILPNLTAPIIMEVMTASTSGSDTAIGTDIATSFTEAILGNHHNCPGINKRQVWGRMATQLFAKSALADVWGGKTIWLVQDRLLRNLELTTKLQFDAVSVTSAETINFLSMKYRPDSKGLDSIELDNYAEKSAGISFAGNNECTDILLPKVYPEKKELLKSLLRRELAAIVLL